MKSVSVIRNKSIIKPHERKKKPRAVPLDR
jgi:hypothetical protein